jgi:hypothetical protein
MQVGPRSIEDDWLGVISELLAKTTREPCAPFALRSKSPGSER